MGVNIDPDMKECNSVTGPTWIGEAVLVCKEVNGAESRHCAVTRLKCGEVTVQCVNYKVC